MRDQRKLACTCKQVLGTVWSSTISKPHMSLLTLKPNETNVK